MPVLRQSPENKNNEHPLPRWLLELTGDPGRVVSHGYHWRTGKQFEFSFDSFKFPSCWACNESYSRLEGNAKRVVVAACKKEALNPELRLLTVNQERCLTTRSSGPGKDWWWRAACAPDMLAQAARW